MNWTAEDFSPLRAKIRVQQDELARLRRANEETKQHIQQAREFLSAAYKSLRIAERLPVNPRHNSN